MRAIDMNKLSSDTNMSGKKVEMKIKKRIKRHSPVVFWYLKITVLLSFEFASWPPNLQTMAKSPKMFWSTWKYPSPYSESQVHMLVCFQPTCEPNTCDIEKRRELGDARRKKGEKWINFEADADSSPWIRNFIDQKIEQT